MQASKDRCSVAILIAAGLTLSLAGGCMVGPEYHPPQTPAPAAWAGVARTPDGKTTVATAQSARLAQWWRQFNDPMLNELIDEGIGANLDLKLAEARLRQARAVSGIARGGLWPSVTATGGYERQHIAGVTPDNKSVGFYQSGL
ncbi:MAG TPA: hypothetical protein VLY45_07095, partial [Nitrospiria bacterium]|nr:hypothetical protein [Nitrospiria bacterium]